MKEALLNIPAFQSSHNIENLFKLKSILFAIILYWAFVKYKKHPIFYIAVAAIVGIIFKF